MTKLRISEGLSLPVEAVTQAIGILAKRRAGKSYLARRFAEELYRSDQQIVIVDPKGDWWGIRSSADGKSDGLPIVMFGGARGDVPLEPGGGALVAKVIVEERVSALLDLSSLRKHEIATFMGVFLEDLYRLKAREEYQTAMMLFIDEADAIAPQKPQPNEARMLGAASDIVRRGGQRGLGCTLVTQRSAVLAKDVLTQVEMLVTLRTIAPQDLAAVKAWIDVHGTVEEQKVLMASLPSLPVGDAWFWSPGWPTAKGIFQRAHTLPISTFDSGATPKPGQKRIEPKKLADVDLDAIRRQMAETIERAKADDPKALRAEIAALRKQLASPRPTAPAQVERVEVPVFDQSLWFQLNEDLAAVDRGALRDLKTAVQVFENRLRDESGKALEDYRRKAQAGATKAKPIIHRDVKPAPVPQKREQANGHASHADTGDPSLGNSGLRRMLIALAQRPQGLTRSQLAIRAGMRQSGTFDTYIGRGRSSGWIDGRGHMTITEAGIDALGSYEPLPEGAALLEYWLRELGDGGITRMLRALADAYPRELTREQLGDAANLALSGTFDTYVGKLRRLELIEGRGSMKASAELFD